MMRAAISRAGRILALSCALLVAGQGCSGQSATIDLAIVMAPGSDLMDRVLRVRLTLSEPRMVLEDERAPGGSFDLAFEVPATGALATVTFEGFDETGELIAFGRTLPLPLALVETRVALLVAPPGSLSEAPVALDPARSDMGVAQLSFGAALAGGRLADGSASATLQVYDGFKHELEPAEDLPEPRAALTAMVGATEYVYFFGGQAADGRDSSSAWRFSLAVPPRGAFSSMNSSAAAARSGARAATQAGDVFVVTGDPALLVEGLNGRVTEMSGAPSLAGTATTVVADSTFYNVFVGSGNGAGAGLVLADGAFQPVDGPGLARVGHATVALPDARTLTVGGELVDSGFLDGDGVVVDVRSLDVDVIPGLLATPRRDAAVAATAELVVVAGGLGSAGQTLGDAEIVDARTLERVMSLPMLVPRSQAAAVALSNGQVLIVGGVDADGQPIATIEVFTPAP